MKVMGLLERFDDPLDRRRSFIELTDKAAGMVAKYFAAIGFSATDLV